jgi:sarcosine oxidase subunit gamma
VPDLVALSSLEGIAVPGRFGREGVSGLEIAELASVGLATVMARRGKVAAVKEAIKAAYGVDPVDGAKVSFAGKVMFVGAGPGHWLAVSTEMPHGELALDLGHSLAGLASVADQSDARGVLRLSGPKVRDVLAKGLPIDLDPRAFQKGDTAVSIINHIGVHLWQTDDAPVYEIAFFRSYSGSFWKWLTDSAAEYGYRVTGRG